MRDFDESINGRNEVVIRNRECWIHARTRPRCKTMTRKLNVHRRSRGYCQRERGPPMP